MVSSIAVEVVAKQGHDSMLVPSCFVAKAWGGFKILQTGLVGATRGHILMLPRSAF